jgi:hypothetical protein
LSLHSRPDGHSSFQGLLYFRHDDADRTRQYGNVPLDGIAFVVLGYTPEEMAKGNWSVGLVIDERANPEQREAVTAIASGAAGGPMAPLSGLIGAFLGVEQAPIRIDRSGLKFAVKAGDLVDMAAEGQKGVDPSAIEPMFLFIGLFVHTRGPELAATTGARLGATMATGGLANPLVSTAEAGSSVALSVLAILLPLVVVPVLAVVVVTLLLGAATTPPAGDGIETGRSTVRTPARASC